jgi:hypothetical protein
VKLLVESQYLAPVTLYLTLEENSNIVFEQFEAYQKRSFRNRCIIAGANGPVSLSIPLHEGREQKKFIRDIRIANQYNWQDQHWKTIVSSYNRSPWFEYYKMSLEKFYVRRFEFLFDFNVELFEWTIKQLEIDKVSAFTDRFVKQYDDQEWLDLRNKMLPNNYQTFRTPYYSQVFIERSGFLPNLSILDLLFCGGKNSLRLLKSVF